MTHQDYCDMTLVEMEAVLFYLRVERVNDDQDNNRMPMVVLYTVLFREGEWTGKNVDSRL
jgi:hypothetical protein